MRVSRFFVRDIWLAAGSMVLYACASSQPDTAADENTAMAESGERACFSTGQVTGFRTLDRTNLIVYAPTKSSAYHVRISPPARELRYANTIAFDSRGARICGHAGEGVVFESGGMARKYFVTDVYQLDTGAVQNLISAFSGEVNIEPQNALEVEIERDIEQDNK